MAQARFTPERCISSILTPMLSGGVSESLSMVDLRPTEVMNFLLQHLAVIYNFDKNWMKHNFLDKKEHQARATIAGESLHRILAF